MTKSCWTQPVIASLKYADASCTTMLVWRTGSLQTSSGCLLGGTGSSCIVAHTVPPRPDLFYLRAGIYGLTHQLHAGGYVKFLEQRALREAQERATAEAQQAEIARLETFMTRFGAKFAPPGRCQVLHRRACKWLRRMECHH